MKTRIYKDEFEFLTRKNGKAILIEMNTFTCVMTFIETGVGILFDYVSGRIGDKILLENVYYEKM